jgi:hypothetical protein
MPFKYQALLDYLQSQNRREIELSLEEIERICGFKLPKSAAILSWWSNSAEDGHYQARAWIDAGYRVLARGRSRLFIKNAE